MSSFTLYREQEKSGIYLALNLKKKCCLLDAKDIVLPEIINDASRVSKC